MRATLILAIMAVMMTAAAALAAETVVKMEVVELSCAKDEVAVGQTLDEAKGVASYEIDITDHFATVTYDDEATSLDLLKSLLDESGYTVQDTFFIEK